MLHRTDVDDLHGWVGEGLINGRIQGCSGILRQFDETPTHDVSAHVIAAHGPQGARPGMRMAATPIARTAAGIGMDEHRSDLVITAGIS